MVTCGICHEEDLSEIGELDSCDHSFCFACIQHWAQIESKCPFCKARFSTISRKTLDLANLPDSDAESDETVRQRFPGTVLETATVPERNQVYLGDDEWAGEEEDPLGDVMCMECNRGDDESNLMLCDGCERACHTYCANLDALPEGQWFCWVCQENHGIGNAEEEANDLVAARRARSQRNNARFGTASDFTLSRSRRRASSPGARSELARPGRRVRRRLVRTGGSLEPRRSSSGLHHVTSDADSILNALERSISARDNAGLSTTAEHRRLAGLRGAWNSVRQGHRPFPASAPSTAISAQIPDTTPQENNPESQAWAAFEASRRAEGRTARRAQRSNAVSVDVQLSENSSPQRPSGSQSASSLARQAIAEARSRGRRLGPSRRPVPAPNPRAVRDTRTSSPPPLARAPDRRRIHQGRLQQPTSPRLRSTSPDRAYRSDPPVGSPRLVHREHLHHREPAQTNRRTHRAGMPQQNDPAQRDHAAQRQTPFAQTDNPNLIPVQQRSRLTQANAIDQSSRHGASHDSQQWSQQQQQQQQQKQPQVSQPNAADHVAWHDSQQQQQQQWPPPLPHHHHQQQLHQMPWPAAPNRPADPPWQQQSLRHDDAQPNHWQWPHAPPLPQETAQQAANLGQGAESVSATGHGAQHAGPDRGDDSSDSSMSQVAAQQQAPQSSQRRAAAQTDDTSGAGTSSRRKADTDAAVMQLPAAVPSLPAMSKQEAADAVKGIIKPLYISQQLSKEQFKAIAQSCTHILADPAKRAGRSPNIVLQDFMKELGLGRQAANL